MIGMAVGIYDIFRRKPCFAQSFFDLLALGSGINYNGFKSLGAA